MKLAATSLVAPVQSPSDAMSPLNGGIGFSGQASVLESTAGYSLLSGQEFAVEIWYRTSPDAMNSGTKPMMVFQLPGSIWLSQDRNTGDLSCSMPVVSGNVDQEVNNYTINSGSRPLSLSGLRYVSCFFFNKSAYLYTNGVLSKRDINVPGDEFGIASDLFNLPFAVGRWVEGKNSKEIFAPFHGTIHMIRLWNNVALMQDAMVPLIQAHGLSTGPLETVDLGEFPPQ